MKSWVVVRLKLCTLRLVKKFILGEFIRPGGMMPGIKFKIYARYEFNKARLKI